MISLRMALENDHEFRGDDTPLVIFEDVATEVPFDQFDFELGPVTSALESYRPVSRRRRQIATEGIALEERGKGFWALLALAVTAALGIIAKMLGWLDGGGSSGGGGGGGGGSPVARVEAKVEKVEASVPKVIEAVEAIQELKKEPDARKLLTKKRVFEDFASSVSTGFTEYHRQLGMQEGPMYESVKKAAEAMSALSQLTGPVGNKIDAITDAWEAYFDKVKKGEDVSNYDWQKAVNSCKEVTDGSDGVYAPGGAKKWEESYLSLIAKPHNTKLGLSSEVVKLSGDDAIKWYAKFSTELEKKGVQSIKSYIDGAKEYISQLNVVEGTIKTLMADFFKKLDENGADDIAWGSKAPEDQGRQLRGLLGISNDGEYDQWHADLRRAQDATKEMCKSYVNMISTMTRELGHLISIANDQLDLYNRTRKALHKLAVQAKKDFTAAGMEIPSELTTAIEKTKD